MTSVVKKGNDFKQSVKDAFSQIDRTDLMEEVPLILGFNQMKKHKFDLGNIDQKVIIECKNSEWTESGNIPSGKLAEWTQALFWFYLAPNDFKKYLIVARCKHPKKDYTLGEYYVKTYGHFINHDINFLEFDTISKTFRRITVK